MAVDEPINTTVREHQMEAVQSMASLFDSLPTKEARREVLAFLAASIGASIKDPQAAAGMGYGYRPKRKW